VTVPAWYEEFADAVAAGEGEYLACESCGETALPPRELCPACGSASLARRTFSDRGTVLSFTEISVTIPKFHGETPYTVLLVEMDEGIALSGQLREASAGDVAIGDEVEVGVETREGGPDVFTFRPVRK
jgi:hypothetical protein